LIGMFLRGADKLLFRAIEFFDAIFKRSLQQVKSLKLYALLLRLSLNASTCLSSLLR